jgi:PAS domain S-box-containing protein
MTQQAAVVQFSNFRLSLSKPTSMQSCPPILSPSTSVFDAAQVMNQMQVGCVLVIENQQLVGIVTEQDMMRVMVARDSLKTNLKTMAIALCMTQPVLTLNETEAEDPCIVIDRFQKTQATCLPVLNHQGHCVGLVTPASVLQSFGSIEPYDAAISPKNASVPTAELEQQGIHLQDKPQALTEEALQASEERLRLAIDSLPVCISYSDIQQRYRFVNKTYEHWLGITQQDIYGKQVLEVIGEKAYQVVKSNIERVLAGEVVQYEAELPYPAGKRYVFGILVPDFDDHSQIRGYCALITDISARKQLEESLRLQVNRDRLIAGLTQRIRNSLDLSEILQVAVTEIQHFLQVDRVLICRPDRNRSLKVVMESVHSADLSVLGQILHEPYLEKQDQLKQDRNQQVYGQSHVRAIEDVAQSVLHPRQKQLLNRLQVQADLVAPILQGEGLWGLLIAHHCSAPHSWQAWEIDLLGQLATQLAIAIQQSELYGQVQQSNTDLEQQVAARTAQLQTAYEFEATLKCITDKVRESLDENQIMQTVVKELSSVIKIICCNAALYNLEQGTSMIRYEYTTLPHSSLGRIARIADYPEIYCQLLEGQPFQFCSIVPSPVRGRVAMLAFPIVDDQDVLGDLWLVAEQSFIFTEQDMRLVQQVASQCAIALRQSRLYQESQAQVTELGKLNRLKDDFLSTVSHELRTPMASIKMAAQMLELSLQQSDLLAPESRSRRYLTILQDECQREISLIDNLLDLSHLDATPDSLILVTVDPYPWLLNLAQPFIDRSRSQQQQFQLDLSTELPPLTTDLSYLERILGELLQNACKYTPPGETIVLSAQAIDDKSISGNKHTSQELEASRSMTATHLPIVNESQLPLLQLRVSNSGVEILEHEHDRIFDKFYRIPNGDPWKHGGTGLGLALVKKRVEQLQGTIEVTSSQGWTVFTVQLPQLLVSKF